MLKTNKKSFFTKKNITKIASIITILGSAIGGTIGGVLKVVDNKDSSQTEQRVLVERHLNDSDKNSEKLEKNTEELRKDLELIYSLQTDEKVDKQHVTDALIRFHDVDLSILERLNKLEDTMEKIKDYLRGVQISQNMIE